MIFRNTLAALLVALTSSMAFADQNSLFIQNYLNSFASRDAQGIYNLIHWEGVDKQSRRSLQKFIRSGFKGRQIRRIYIEDVPADFNPSYVQDGQRYELNLKPTGQLNIVYISNKGKRTSSQLFVGEHNGRLKIGSAIVAPESVACSDDKSC
ncbi:MAG: hypothetical protein CSA60_04285 [Neptuniibacter caesariensis]|uniref:Uncharacterized protein n=1 Tax=Neptuniibacter caesariensis TaxID=207954 RepID=A0A2G6JK09_NEPCE|nr:MAG: hypothetical protein CSA60_04285 [Neptuniibacter caesariensis]